MKCSDRARYNRVFWNEDGSSKYPYLRLVLWSFAFPFILTYVLFHFVYTGRFRWRILIP